MGAGDVCCRLLTYYDGPEAEQSNGCILLVDQAYSVSLPKHERSGHPFGIRIDLQACEGVEQKLKWILAATDEDERQSWLAILGESGAVLSDKIRIAKQLSVQGAEKHGPAEKAGWLLKEGRVNKAFKKRWCLLLPPPAYHANGDEYETLNRYLVYYDAREGQKAKGVVVLPHRGYLVRRPPPHVEEGTALAERAIRLDIVTGPQAGRHYVLGTLSDDDLFSWEMSLLVGSASVEPLHVHMASQRQRFAAALVLQTAGASFDPTDSADVALLRRFWAAGHTGELALDGAAVPDFTAKGEAWKRWGFQRDDPGSDLRAAGRLALRQLVFFLEKHPHEATKMAAEQSRRDLLVSGYPWAAVGVNVTRLLLMLFDLAAPMGMQTDWRLARRAYWHLIGDGPESPPFCELYCLAFVVVDKEFNESNGTYLEFGKVMQRARTKLLHLLANCARDDTVANLWIRAASTDKAAELHEPVHIEEYRHPWVHVTHTDTRLRATSSAVFADLLAEPGLTMDRQRDIQRLRLARDAEEPSTDRAAQEQRQFGELLENEGGDYNGALAAQRAIKERDILRAYAQ
eukprot:COSAG02_NODE_2382_length_8992_cov_5.447318_3_plen_572_part_00